VALVYLVLTLISSQLFSALERSMNPAERTKRTRTSSVGTLSSNPED